ncbi:hypothetical protein VCRA2116O29_20076 [Vibrio crassostreae]|nr:hypothetical protein VCRA2116O29_20076 [Vibrio crassostreae]CAK2464363.1 hypothetical protein VCRA2119O48_20079 [Vibrio crassostreae]CAK2838744.1 hypothetical protein VCRA2133E348_290010 [Vibrio crassostreae]CAK3332729.1 hypothetical protein VCRA213O314_290057 [Vibrio crassostreae]CAK3809893.1 hypothetical protein VCRA2123O74_30077 [Vibrio crassostreae]
MLLYTFLLRMNMRKTKVNRLLITIKPEYDTGLLFRIWLL